MSNSAFLRFSIVPPKFLNGCLLDNFWCCIEIFGLCGGHKNVDKGIRTYGQPDKGNVSSLFDVVMLVILLHSLCTCQEQSQNVGTFLSKKSWLRVRAKKWQICVGSRLHILCYSGSIRVWASPYRLVHSEVTLTKNALKKCPCQICLKIYMRSKTLFLEIYTFSSVSTATEWKSGPVGCCCRCYPGRILSPHSSAPRSDQRSPRRRGRKWWRIIRRRSLLDCSSHTLLQSKTPNTPKTANYAKKAPNMQKKSTKYSKILQIFIYAVLSRKNFVPNSRTFWCNLQA